MICPRISRRCSSIICTHLIRTWCLNQSICTRRLDQSTSHSRSSHLNLKHQCRNCRPLFFYRASKTSHHPLWTYSTWTSNSLLRKSKWPSSRTSARMMTSNTTSASAVTFWASRRTWRILTTPRPSCIIYFRKSSSTSAPTYHDPALTTMHTRMLEAETDRAISRTTRRRMARPKILILISLK
jgi:hypothetical protein